MRRGPPRPAQGDIRDGVLGAVLFVVLTGLDVAFTIAALAAMTLLFALRLAATRYDLNAPSVTFGDGRPGKPSRKLERGA